MQVHSVAGAARAVQATQQMCQSSWAACLSYCLVSSHGMLPLDLPGRPRGCKHAGLLVEGQAWSAEDMAGTAWEDWQLAASSEQTPGKRLPGCHAGTAGGTTFRDLTETGASARLVNWAGGALGAGTAR